MRFAEDNKDFLVREYVENNRSVLIGVLVGIVAFILIVCIIASNKSEILTLQDIGSIFNVTRMRICQIEKIAINKIKDKIAKSLNIN